MSLLDIVVGDAFHVNQNQREANMQVCRALRLFVKSRLDRFPAGERFFSSARRDLYTFYLCSSASVGRFFSDLTEDHDNVLRNYKNAIESLAPADYLLLLLSIHTGHIVIDLLNSQGDRGSQNWFNLCSEGVCDMYGRPDSYMVAWVDSFEWLSESEESVNAKVIYKAIDEILQLLRIKKNISDFGIWAGVLKNSRLLAGPAINDSVWQSMVDEEIANLG